MMYEGRVFRPPSEAYSLIVQSTIGCSHNKCHFCDMYREKNFRLRPLSDVLEDFSRARVHYVSVERIFIADGDALIRDTKDWIAILEHIRQLFPECERVGCYASPKSIILKSAEDLKLLGELGLHILYLGLETGSDKILEDMHKGETAEQIIEAGLKAKASGIVLSVTAISGLGGVSMREEHAIKTAEALSRINPDFIGLLTLMIVEGTPLYQRYKSGEFLLSGPREIAEETVLLLENIDSDGSVFRSNHPSNYLSLKGTLNQDKERMIRVLTESTEFRKEWARGL